MSCIFAVSRGTCHGSILSPTLFNIFTNDLLCELQAQRCGASIGAFNGSSLAYADDSVLSASVPGLQMLIDMLPIFQLSGISVSTLVK